MSFTIRQDGIMDPQGRYPNPLTGQPYSKSYLHLANKTKDGKPDGWIRFRPWLDRIEIFKKIHKNNILLAIIPPGTGKTVILPKLLLHYFGYQRKVICTTPRQATTSIAGEYAAKCLDVPLYMVDEFGDDIINPNVKNKKDDNRYETGMKIVAYKHAAKNMSNRNTLLLFTTDGSLKQTILSGNDSTLSNYGGVIIDEAHERSVNIDIVLALLMDIIKVRPDFKVIIMSATIDETLFTDYFKRINLGHTYSVYKVPELQPLFKRDYIKETKKIDAGNIIEIIYNKINNIILNPKLPPVGDILAFVTSDAETQKVKKRIDNNIRNYPVNNKPYAIAFSSKIAESDKTIATKKGALKTIVLPTPDAPQGFSRKVIIGTNAVESSVTFGDDMTYVIESGMAYEKTYDADNYCYITGKFYVSQASIEQRCGRTGRTCDGKCLQLYTDTQFDKFKKFTEPKIILEDFTKELLGIISLPMNGNLQKGLDFINRMIQEPKTYKTALNRAYYNLINMGLLDNAGNITYLGRICNAFNKFDIKIAKMVVGGYYLQCMQYCVALGAVLQVVKSFEDIFMQPLGMDEDPVLQRQYDENIKRLKVDRGDHLTLLNIYVNWISSADPYQYATSNGLSIHTLGQIQKAQTELGNEVMKLQFDIKNLNLFNVPSTAFGGGSQTDNHTNHISGNNTLLCGGYKFDGEMYYEDSEDESEGGDSSDDELDEDDIEIENLSKMPNTEDIELMLGGAEQETDFKTILSRESALDFINEINSQANIQNYSTDINLSNNFNQHDGGNRFNDIRLSRKHQTEKQTQTTSRFNIKHHQKLTKINTSYNSHHSQQLQSSTQTYGGGHNHSKDDKIDYVRNNKIIEVITLKNIQSKTITIPSRIDDRIMAALYFGFSNQISANTGSKKYNIKFSPQKGNISKSVYDYNNILPEKVIYHEFTIMKTMGRPDDAKMNIVSELKNKDFLVFLDINEIKKQL